MAHDFVIFLAALLPAAALMFYIYRMDRIEKEPVKLLLLLAFFGVLSALISMFPEELIDALINDVTDEGALRSVLSAFLCAACVEEGAKLILLRLGSWKNRAFNYKFDGIVYAVFVGVGFAAFENLLYFSDSDLVTISSRTLLSLPGHMCFAVVMGLYYGKAKACEAAGDKKGRKENFRKAYLFPVLFHGIYDACLFVGSTLTTILFLVFVAVFFITVFKKIKYEAARDCLIDPSEAQSFVRYLFSGAVVRGNAANDTVSGYPAFTSDETVEDIREKTRTSDNNRQ